MTIIYNTPILLRALFLVCRTSTKKQKQKKCPLQKKPTFFLQRAKCKGRLLLRTFSKSNLAPLVSTIYFLGIHQIVKS